MNKIHMFYDSCSAAWFREDGTLDGEALTQYYTAMQNVYALDGAHQEKMREMLESEGRSCTWAVSDSR